MGGGRSVGVVGASGFGGTELLRLLARHPEVTVAVRAAAGNAGRRLGDLAPGLPPAAGGDEVLVAPDPDRLAELDLVLLATPDEVSLELAPVLVAAGTRVVDLSGAFRLRAADYDAWYRRPHTAPSHAADGAEPAVYGLTEWARDEVAAARLVANPGCYPTATLLGLRPLVELVEPDGVVVSAVSGTSGAGRSTRDDLQASVVLGDVVAYGAPSHRHTVEIETHLGGGAPVAFTPHLVPVARGMLVTASAVLRPGVGQADVDAALSDAYAAEAFVHVLPAGTFPRLKAVNGSNACQVSAVVDPRTGRVLVSSAIDNLGKGAAGQALQNANLMLGLDEELGLEAIGVWP
ncbi:MAG: N-acetyl-gamma-glutamyl-phosphate reductase [Actinomycetota bacterium]|jgi:N-acetyl-gamma-glutamyl-phosphate reductase